jgi:hypothetical protein
LVASFGFSMFFLFSMFNLLCKRFSLLLYMWPIFIKRGESLFQGMVGVI